jgi:predicted RecB family nuclease
MLQALAAGHEAAVLAQLEAADQAVTRIPLKADPETTAAATRAAMREGVAVIAQGVLLDPPWYGRPDFLVHVGGPSALGPWHYEVWDAKLAHHPRVLAWVQTAVYSLLLERAQGRLPASMALILGTGTEERFPVAHAAAFVERARRRLLAAAEAPLPDALPCPDRIAACEECRWREPCDAQRRAADHLSWVADIRRDQIRKLRQAGIATLADLAAHDPAVAVPGIGAAALGRLVRQARLQRQAREDGAWWWRHVRRLTATPPNGMDEGKEQRARFDGSPLFPLRFAHTAGYTWSDEEKVLCEAVTAYAQAGLDRADRRGGGRR